jgi:hypothetical protein
MGNYLLVREVRRRDWWLRATRGAYSWNHPPRRYDGLLGGLALDTGEQLLAQRRPPSLLNNEALRVGSSWVVGGDVGVWRTLPYGGRTPGQSDPELLDEVKNLPYAHLLPLAHRLVAATDARAGAIDVVTLDDEGRATGRELLRFRGRGGAGGVRASRRRPWRAPFGRTPAGVHGSASAALSACATGAGFAQVARWLWENAAPPRRRERLAALFWRPAGAHRRGGTLARMPHEAQVAALEATFGLFAPHFLSELGYRPTHSPPQRVAPPRPGRHRRRSTWQVRATALAGGEESAARWWGHAEDVADALFETLAVGFLRVLGVRESAPDDERARDGAVDDEGAAGGAAALQASGQLGGGYPVGDGQQLGRA